jgi:hypothetical protein
VFTEFSSAGSGPVIRRNQLQALILSQMHGRQQQAAQKPEKVTTDAPAAERNAAKKLHNMSRPPFNAYYAAAGGIVIEVPELKRLPAAGEAGESSMMRPLSPEDFLQIIRPSSLPAHCAHSSGVPAI